MSKIKIFLVFALSAIVVLALYAQQEDRRSLTAVDTAISNHGESLVDQGRQIFRFDTFGDQDFWGGVLGLHQAIEGAKLGGVGPGVSPATALAVGLKSSRRKRPIVIDQFACVEEAVSHGGQTETGIKKRFHKP